MAAKIKFLLNEFDEQVSVKDPSSGQRYNWGLHPQFGPEYWAYEQRKHSTLWFDPAPLSEEAYTEHDKTEDKGVWVGYHTQTSGISISADIKSKTINIIGSLQDPRISYALATSNALISGLGDYTVRTVNRSVNNSKSENYYKTIGSLNNLIGKMKTISGKAPDYAEPGKYKEFKHNALEDISDVNWYHATRLSNLDSILKKGLLPSKTTEQGEGWTEFNFNLQNAVYLTSDEGYANNIAETLLEKFGKPTVVIKVSGEALKDYTKLVVDEDSLRDEYEGRIRLGMLQNGMPDYMTSVADSIQSLGYRDIIPASHLETIRVFDYEYTNELEENEQPDVASYTWQEWNKMKPKTLKEKLDYLLEGTIEPIRQHLSIPLPDDLLALSDIFKKAGKKFYLVGGAVRDALLGKEPKDLDIATDAAPEEVRDILSPFPEYKILDLGVAFGIVKIITPEGNDFEVARFRTDVGVGRRPDAVEYSTIEADYARRDLTINALYYDIDSEEVIDYVGGIADIKNNVIKTVGNPQDRFNEDRLRILRFIRFVARFGGDPDPATDQAILQDNSLQGVSGERIRDEFLKGIKTSKSTTEFFKLIDHYGLWPQIFPGLTVNEDRPDTKNAPMALALMLRDNPPDLVAKKLNAAKYSAEEVSKIKFLLDFMGLTPENALKLKKLYKISRLDESELREFSKEAGRPEPKIAEAFIQYEPSVSAADLPGFSGKELGAEIFRREGEIFRDMLGESKKSNLNSLLKKLF